MGKRQMQTWSRRLALLAGGLIVGAAFGELGVRALGGDRFARRPVFYAHDASLELIWEPSAQLHHRYHGSDFSIRIDTDEHGYRLGSLGPYHESDQLLVLLGDSYTFGWGVSTAETYASYLDELVSPVRVANLGVGGYGTTQSVARFGQLLDREPEARIGTVVFMHSHNDMVDNVKVLLAQGGATDVEEVPPNGSSSHVLNLLARFWSAVGQHAEAATNPGDTDKDVLFHIRYSRVKGHVEEIEWNGTTIAVSELESLEHQAKPTLDRGLLTEIQRALLQQSQQRLHELAAQRGITVVHAVIDSAPQWYVEEISRIVARAKCPDLRSIFLGRVPSPENLEGPRSNAHSGGHFTPGLNAYYAGYLADELRDCGALN